MKDEEWMRLALEEAQKCLRATSESLSFDPSSFIPHPSRLDDVPVGAICTFDGQIIGRGHNRRALDFDSTAHAEIFALKAAAQTLKTTNLSGVTLYVTLEPCPMCAGALWLSRVSRLVFGAWDAKAGACGSVFDIPRDPRLNHRLDVRGGVLETECVARLSEFFASRRG